MPLASNYGGILQNFALQTVLRRLGYDPITVRFPSMYQNRSLVSSLYLYANLLCRHLVKRLLGKQTTMPLRPRVWKKNTYNLEKFIQRNIETTDYVDKVSIEVFKQYWIGFLIVGSDQVWRPEVPNVINRYFCGFADNVAIPRISYAVSLALDEWTFSPEQTQEIMILLKKFSCVSVREKNGVALLKDNANCNAEWVIDPTMLLTKEDYLGIIKDTPRSDNQYIFTYILNPNEEKMNYISELSKSKGLKVVSLNDKAADSSASIETWLSHFRDSSFVITDSFHGTVFSVLFEKQFVCFENPHRGNARMESLKIMTGLHDRFVCGKVTTLSDINYSTVSAMLEQMRGRSIQYLQNSIKKSWIYY